MVGQGFLSTVKFRREKYDRTVTASKLFPDNPLLQVELEGAVEPGVGFIITGGNPGWVALDAESGLLSVGAIGAGGVEGGVARVHIAAVDKDLRRIATTMLQLTVLGPRIQALFPRKLYLFTIPKGSLKSSFPHFLFAASCPLEAEFVLV